ncbi:Tyrocidine synthase 3 [compost metagenome]
MKHGKRKYPTIEHQAERAWYPLSYQQERIFYLDQLRPDEALWNKISAKRLKGKLHVEALQHAVQELAERHQVLRTMIRLKDHQPAQSFPSNSSACFYQIDLTEETKHNREQRITELMNEQCSVPIKVREEEPLFQVHFILLEKEEAILILKLHHIISDASTFEILWRDLKMLYNRQIEDSLSCELSHPGVPYGDYVLWQREMFADDRTREQEEYWLEQFQGELPILDLPGDFNASSELSFRGAIEKLELPGELVSELKKMCMKQRVILFSIFLSAYYVLLQKYCRQEDIVIGTVFSGRHYGQEISSAAGFFVNTVAIRADVDTETTWGNLLHTVHDKVNEAFYMQDYPFERLVQKLHPNRQNSRNPLYRAMFNMVAESKDDIHFAGLKERWEPAGLDSTQTDLLFDVRELDGKTELWVEYSTELFRADTIKRLMQLYVNLLHNIAAKPDALIKDLQLTNSQERDFLLESLNSTQQEYIVDGCIHEWFEKQAELTPDRTALIFKDEILTYIEVNQRANQLARVLRNFSVTSGSIVSIMVHRSFDMVISALAVFKAGGAYVPIDPGLAEERIKYMLEDSKSCLLVTDPAIIYEVGIIPKLLLNEPLIAEQDIQNLNQLNKQDDLAYIMYTSGSTGKPKGVMIEHAAALSTLCFMQATFPLGMDDAHLLKTNYSFDVSVTELFGWFFDGGKLAILGPEEEKEPLKIVEAIRKHRITHINFSPSFLHAFIEDLNIRNIHQLSGLKYVFAAGEALKAHVVKQFYTQIAGETELVNVYGPTEAAIYATYHRVPRHTDEEKIPIGQALHHMNAYILDKHSQLVPNGVIGELCLGGKGLARGYLNRSEMTKGKFVVNPYKADEILYRTGDLVSRRDDGAIDYYGRMDQQVKIRGYRIELGEIEETLANHPSIKWATVMVREDIPDQQRLVAYCVVDSEVEVHEEEWRHHLAQWLPSYMIPSAFVGLSSIPLNSSGKVDKYSLPAPEQHSVVASKEQRAVTDTERRLIEITEGILGISGIAPDNSFFDLGGNSLLTIRFISEIEHTFKISLSLLDFIDLPNIENIAVMIEPQLLAGRSAAEKNENTFTI